MNIWLVVLVFLIIAVIIILLLWAFWPNVTGQSTSNGSNRTVTVGFLNQCDATYICGDNLTCSSGVCLKDVGQSCSLSTDCVSGSKCLGSTNNNQGVCSTAQSNVLNGPCPCTTAGLTCDLSNGLCKVSTGSSGCSSNLDCLSNAACINGLCTVRKQLGEVCLPGQCGVNLNCSGGDCTNGIMYCQPPNINSCELGAVCLVDGSPSCDSGLNCVSSGNNFTCQIGNEGWAAPCDADSPCITGLYCDGNLGCIFQQPPNDCSGNQGCPAGQTCSIGGECTVNTGSMCTVDDNCTNGTCNQGMSSIYIWDVGTLQWKIYANTPRPGVQFKRISATTSLNSDRLWGLEYSSQPGKGGLWRLVNARTGTWVKVRNCTTKRVTVLNNIQTTTVETIISIASDLRNIYVLVQTTVTTDTNSNSTSWGIYKVGVTSTGSMLTPVSNATPPQFDGMDIVNIVDFDVNAGEDILVVGGIDMNVDQNTVYSLADGETSFIEVDIMDRPDSIQQARFYYVDPSITTQIQQQLGLTTPIVNAADIAYVSGDSVNNQLLQFTGPLSNQSEYPIGGPDNYQIIDFSLSNFNDSGSFSNIDSLWIVAPNPSSLNTGFYQILQGTQYSIPGYVGQQSLLLATDNATYCQSSGVCN